MVGSIFHYTDAAGLIGIVSSKSLFATHYRCLNDSTEGEIIRDLILPIFENEVADVLPPLAKRGGLEAFYVKYGSGDASVQAGAMCDEIVRIVDETSPHFVLSFCRHDEGSDAFRDGLLSQWRGYSDGGGFAVEFDEDGMGAIRNAEDHQFIYAVSKASDVVYSNHQPSFDPGKFKGFAEAVIARSVGEREKGTAVKAAMSEYISVAPFLKHPGFIEEQEYRVVMAPVRKSVGDKGFVGKHKPIKFRVRNNSVVPYIEISATKEVALPIKSVIVGPNPNQEMQCEAVEMILENAGIDAKVRKSRIPFRK